MRLVAVHAAHAGVVHFAAEKRGEHVILIPDLAVRMVNFRRVGNDMREVVEIPVAWLEVPRQLRAARVAFAAGREPLCAVELAQRRVAAGRPGVLRSPVNMRFHRSVTGFAAYAHRRHRCVIGIGRFVVILSETRVVA